MFMGDSNPLHPGYEPGVPRSGPTDNLRLLEASLENQDAVSTTYKAIADRIIAGCVLRNKALTPFMKPLGDLQSSKPGAAGRKDFLVFASRYFCIGLQSAPLHRQDTISPIRRGITPRKCTGRNRVPLRSGVSSRCSLCRICRLLSLNGLLVVSFIMERRTGFEPATSTMARWHSAN